MDELLKNIRDYIISHKVDYPVTSTAVNPEEIIAAINSEFLSYGLEAFVNPPMSETGESVPTLAYIFYVTRDGRVYCQCQNGGDYDITTLLGTSLQNIWESIEKRVAKLENGRI